MVTWHRDAENEMSKVLIGQSVGELGKGLVGLKRATS